MSRIDELVARLCPDGVPYKRLSEIAEIGTGSSNTQDQVEEGEFPFYVRSPQVKRASTYEFDETAIITAGDGDVGKVFHFVEGKYALHQRAYRIHVTASGLQPKYCYWYMVSKFRKYIETKACSATVKSLRKPMFQEFPVPVPPMEIQKEIVQILDSFSELETELETELEVRTQQYGYYRDRLVDSPLMDNYDLTSVSLGNICEKPMYGSGAKAVDGNPASDIRYIRITDITEKGTLGRNWKTASSINQKYLLRQGDILFARSGATAGKTLLYNNAMGKALFAGYLIRFRINSKAFLPRFVYHCVNSSRYWNWLDHVKGGGAQPNVSAKDYASFSIPVLPLEEQRRIVSVLDKFDALVNDLSSGIPAEIKARRKQYEYYRDKLLTFKEKPGD